MKIQVVVDFEIEPEVAAVLLADPFPNQAVDKWLCDNSPIPATGYNLMHTSLDFNAKEVYDALGKHLANENVKNARQLANIVV